MVSYSYVVVVSLVSFEGVFLRTWLLQGRPFWYSHRGYSPNCSGKHWEKFRWARCAHFQYHYDVSHSDEAGGRKASDGEGTHEPEQLSQNGEGNVIAFAEEGERC